MSALAGATKRPGGRRCGGAIEFGRDALGRVTEHCGRCARRRAGICADCPRRVSGAVGKAERCTHCKRAKLTRDDRRWKHRYPERVSVLGRRRREARAAVEGRRLLTRSECGRAGARASALVRLDRVSPTRRQEIARLGGLTAQRNRRARAEQERAA